MIIIYKIVINNISYKNFAKMLDNWMNFKKAPYKLFLCKQNNKYYGIDNEKNEFFIEEFDSKTKALFWLLRPDYSAKEIKNMKEFQIKKILAKEKYKICRFKEELQL